MGKKVSILKDNIRKARRKWSERKLYVGNIEAHLQSSRSSNKERKRRKPDIQPYVHRRIKISTGNWFLSSCLQFHWVIPLNLCSWGKKSTNLLLIGVPIKTWKAPINSKLLYSIKWLLKCFFLFSFLTSFLFRKHLNNFESWKKTKKPHMVR